MGHIKEIKESTVKRALRLHQLWLDSERRKGRQLIVTDESSLTELMSLFVISVMRHLKVQIFHSLIFIEAAFL